MNHKTQMDEIFFRVSQVMNAIIRSTSVCRIQKTKALKINAKIK